MLYYQKKIRTLFEQKKMYNKKIIKKKRFPYACILFMPIKKSCVRNIRKCIKNFSINIVEKDIIKYN